MHWLSAAAEMKQDENYWMIRGEHFESRNADSIGNAK